MKRKITSLFLATCAVFTMSAQVMLQEDFIAPWSPAANNWVIQNNSDPTATPGQPWFSPNASLTFPAYNGAPNDYYACNWASTSNTVTGQTLSNWLITPTVTVVDGAVLEFATRTSTNPTTFADRLEVYYSTAGAGTNVGNTSASVGTFSTVIVAINPNLTATGYPGSWTVYTATLSGVTNPGVGRLAFRYHVPNGGFGGANSDYIGLDAVKYTLPCAVTLQSFTTCANESVTLTPTGGSANTSYTWNPGGSNSSSIVVNPASTTIYTLSYAEGTNPACPDQTATVTIGSLMSVSVAATSNTICAGQSVTLTANAAAQSFSWNTGSTATTITVSPAATTIYTVAAYNGVFPAISCAGANTVQIQVLPLPTVTAALAPTLVCSGSNYSLTGSGAAAYLWFNTSTTAFTNNPLPLTAGTPGPRSYTLIGIGANGCPSALQLSNGLIMDFTVNPTPTVTASSNTNIACTNSTVMLTASGADTYAWSGSATSTLNPLTYTTPATAGNYTFSITGTNQEGCSSSTVVAVQVTVCAVSTVGIDGISEIVETNIYPNPFVNEIRINGLEGTVIVYNAIGQQVAFEKVVNSISINTSEFPKGVYIVKAYNVSGELVTTSRLVKN